MDAEQWQIVDKLVQSALALDPQKRTAFLDAACSSPLRATVDRLMVEAERCDSFLERPALVDLDGAAVETIDRPLLEAVGPYKIKRFIGAGGMGAVFLAERSDGEFDLQVAVKLLQSGWANESLVRRFRIERQILANLDNPNIANLLDGGSTPEGQPYLVMEYVEGVPVDEYCDREALTVSRRVELFFQICSAVRHAHRHLVVHRDLKPGNILVSSSGQVKLLDFGIAKLLDSTSLPSADENTQTGMRPMSLAYASPEQIRGQTITTVSDIFSLGVLLYQLLTGKLPKRFHDLDPEAVAREVQREPTTPSVAVLADAYREVEASHFDIANLKQLSRQLRGDLDNIVLKAMAEEPDRRYGTVGELVEDLKRFLAGETVRARPQTFSYRASRFLRRHVVGTAVTMVFAVLVLGFTASTTIQSRSIARERDKAEQVIQFLVGLFEVSDPGYERADEITARQVLDRGADRVDHELMNQPAARAAVLHTVGRVYRNLGVYDQAILLLERALETNETMSGTQHTELVRILTDLGIAYLDHGEYDESARVLDWALEVGRTELGGTHPDTAAAMHWRGFLATKLGEFDEGINLLRSSLDVHDDLYGPNSLDSAIPLMMLADALMETGEYQEAETLYLCIVRTLEEQANPNSMHLATALDRMGLVRWRRSDSESAITYHRRALALYDEVLDANHPSIGSTWNNLGLVHQYAGNLSEAEVHFRRALEIKANTESETSPSYAAGLNNLAGVLLGRGDLEAARDMWEGVLEICASSLGGDHHYYGLTLIALGMVDRCQGRYAEAHSKMLDGLTVVERALGPDHIELGFALARLCDLSIDMGDYESAAELQSRAATIVGAAQMENSPWLATLDYHLGRILAQSDHFEEARNALEQAATEAGAILPPTALSAGVVAKANLALGDLAREQGNHINARSSWLEALRILECNAETTEHAQLRETCAIALMRLGRDEEAQPYVDSLAEEGWRPIGS